MAHTTAGAAGAALARRMNRETAEGAVPLLCETQAKKEAAKRLASSVLQDASFCLPFCLLL